MFGAQQGCPAGVRLVQRDEEMSSAGVMGAEGAWAEQRLTLRSVALGHLPCGRADGWLCWKGYSFLKVVRRGVSRR